MIRRFLGIVLCYCALCALGVSQVNSFQPPGDKSNSTPTQSSEPAKEQNSPLSAPAPASTPGDSTYVEPIKKQKADYPPKAEEDRLEGEVRVKVVISQAGDVEKVDVLKGDPILAEAAVDAVKKWKFKPFIRGGKAVKISTEIPFNFSFADKGKNTATPGDSTHVEPIKTQRADYPLKAQQGRLQGEVRVKVLVSEAGDVESVEVL